MAFKVLRVPRRPAPIQVRRARHQHRAGLAKHPAIGTQHQHCREASTIGNTAGAEQQRVRGFGCEVVGNFGCEGYGGLAIKPMSSGFCALGHDERSANVDGALHMLQGLYLTDERHPASVTFLA